MQQWEEAAGAEQEGRGAEWGSVAAAAAAAARETRGEEAATRQRGAVPTGAGCRRCRGGATGGKL